MLLRTKILKIITRDDACNEPLGECTYDENTVDQIMQLIEEESMRMFLIGQAEDKAEQPKEKDYSKEWKRCQLMHQELMDRVAKTCPVEQPKPSKRARTVLGSFNAG